MNNDQFTYWLQGFVQMNDGKEPTKEQWQMIKDHLQLCFRKMTPPIQPYAKGVGTGGVGSGTFWASGGSVDGSGTGWPIDKYGNHLTNAQIQAQKTKGGGGC